MKKTLAFSLTLLALVAFGCRDQPSDDVNPVIEEPLEATNVDATHAEVSEEHSEDVDSNANYEAFDEETVETEPTELEDETDY